jgi:hypothetical protein
MPDLYRLRLELVDRPGALAYVSAVLARRHLDIVDVVVHDMSGDRGVNEIVVRGPTHLNVTALGADLEHVDARLASCARCEEPHDPVAWALEWATRVARSPDPVADAPEAIRTLVPGAMGCALTLELAARHDAGRQALLRQLPVVVRTGDLPDALGGRHGAPRWLLAAPVPREDPQLVAFAARPLAAPFTSTEISRTSAVVTSVLLAGSTVPS